MNRILIYTISIITLALSLCITGCSGIGAKSPSEVVAAAYMAANAGEYSKAESYLSSELINTMKSGLGALVGGMKGMWDETTRDGNIQRIEILKESIRGEGAKVDFRIHFKDGKTKDNDEPLIKEKGKWKITIG